MIFSVSFLSLVLFHLLPAFLSFHLSSFEALLRSSDRPSFFMVLSNWTRAALLSTTSSIQVLLSPSPPPNADVSPPTSGSAGPGGSSAPSPPLPRPCSPRPPSSILPGCFSLSIRAGEAPEHRSNLDLAPQLSVLPPPRWGASSILSAPASD